MQLYWSKGAVSIAGLTRDAAAYAAVVVDVGAPLGKLRSWWRTVRCSCMRSISLSVFAAIASHIFLSRAHESCAGPPVAGVGVAVVLLWLLLVSPPLLLLLWLEMLLLLQMLLLLLLLPSVLSWLLLGALTCTLIQEGAIAMSDGSAFPSQLRRAKAGIY